MNHEKDDDAVEAPERERVPISSASLAQLRSFAKELGVAISPTMPRHVITKKLAEEGHWTNDHILIEDAATTLGTEAKVAAGAMKEPMVELTLPNQEGPGGKQALPVAVNGVCILIPRNKRVKVKLRYFSALEIAIGTTLSMEMNEANGKEETIATDAPAYPVTMHRMPSDEEIAKWKEWEARQPAWHNSYSRNDLRRIAKENREDQEAA